MCPTRKNYLQFHKEVNTGFQESVKNLFIRNYNGTKCTIPLIVQILLFAVQEFCVPPTTEKTD